jgi:hypothetical protein
MRLRWKVLLAVAGLAALSVAAYGELVLDIRVPRSPLAEVHGIHNTVSIEMADFHRAGEAMKEKYGPSAKTALQTPGARLITTVNGKVVEEGRVPAQFSDARGLFVVGPRGQLESTFPFELDPRKVPAFGERNHSVGASYLKNRFGEQLPAKYFAFSDLDATTDTCVGLSASDLGLLGALFRIEQGTFCVIFWRGASPASMLIGVTLAHGDPWMRPFTRRICRSLTSIALARIAAADRAPPPDYAGCILVDRPDRSGANETLQAHVYEVNRNAALARIH